MPIPDKDTLVQAHQRILPYIHRTPIMTNTWLNAHSGATLLFKCENFQKGGAFKIRGATNTVLQLTDQQVANGVVTHSSGNHAQALALAAGIRGIPAHIVMPETAPKVKVDAVRGYGGRVIFCANTDQARANKVEEVIQATGATLVHPFDDYRIIAGQSTVTKELLEDVDPDIVIAPIGGGGLLSGACLAADLFQPSVEVIAAEPLGADDAYRSLKKGVIVPNTDVHTIADGLRTTIGVRNFKVMKTHVRSILTVSDEEIVEAMRFLWERMKLVVEPSGAVPLAAILKNTDLFAGKRVGVILSGGNVDLQQLPFA